MVVPTRGTDIDWIVETGLRDSDLAELHGLGQTTSDALQGAWEISRPLLFTILVDGTPAGLFGAAPLDNVQAEGSVWLLGTDVLDTVPRDLLREGAEWVSFLHQFFPRLTNWVSEDNTLTIRWLKKMGFRFPGDTFTTPSGVVYRKFTSCVQSP